MNMKLNTNLTRIKSFSERNNNQMTYALQNKLYALNNNLKPFRSPANEEGSPYSNTHLNFDLIRKERKQYSNANSTSPSNLRSYHVGQLAKIKEIEEEWYQLKKNLTSHRFSDKFIKAKIPLSQDASKSIITPKSLNYLQKGSIGMMIKNNENNEVTDEIKRNLLQVKGIIKRKKSLQQNLKRSSENDISENVVESDNENLCKCNSINNISVVNVRMHNMELSSKKLKENNINFVNSLTERNNQKEIENKSLSKIIYSNQLSSKVQNSFRVNKYKDLSYDKEKDKVQENMLFRKHSEKVISLDNSSQENIS